MTGDLQGKVAVVAGGAGGIGSATSLRLARMGAAVVVADLNASDAAVVAEAIVAAGGQATAIDFDISDDDSVARVFTVAASTYGGVDVVHVNAADFSERYGSRDDDLVAIDLDVFDRILAVDLRGYFLVTRHAVPMLLARGGGAIAYTSSGAAFTGGPTRVAYAIAKSGVNSLVRHVATRWGKEGIRANGVAPGLVLTDLVRQRWDEAALATALDQTRTTRLGEPDDIARMVTFLLSDEGAWINGQVISVDGGVMLR
jgi:NAD(P)-dependent dehydrogenase (short-subunit alcohol dehydrogenase family)